MKISRDKPDNPTLADRFVSAAADAMLDLDKDGSGDSLRVIISVVDTDTDVAGLCLGNYESEDEALRDIHILSVAVHKAGVSDE